MIDLKLLKIKQTAKKVRRACDIFARSDEAGLFDFYHKNNSGLFGMCAIASFSLREKLRQEGINVDIQHGWFGKDYGHVWNIYKKQTIIDLTATQFMFVDDEYDRKKFGKIPKVFILNKDNDLYNPEYGIRNSLRHYGYWPSTQRPHEGVIERILDLV